MIGTIINMAINQAAAIRQTPTQKGEVLCTVGLGETVNVIGKQGDWYLVDNFGIRGYIHSRYVALPGGQEVNGIWDTIKDGAKNIWDKITGNTQTAAATTASLASATATTLYVATQKDPLNLRASASTAAKSLAKIPRGAAVEALSSDSGGWTKVKYNGQTGYASSSLLSLTPPSGSSTSKTVPAPVDTSKNVPVSVDDAGTIVDPNTQNNMTITDKTKKILLTVGIVAGVGGLAYYFLKKKKSDTSNLSGYGRRKKKKKKRNASKQLLPMAF